MNLRRATVKAQGAEILLRAELGHATTGFVLSIETDASMAVYLAAELARAARNCPDADLATVAAAKALEEALRSQPPLPELVSSTLSTPHGDQPQPQPNNPS